MRTQEQVNEIVRLLMEEYPLADCTLPFDELIRFLKEKGEERALDIHIQRQDIFEAMHRI